MILDTTVLVDLQREVRRKQSASATALLVRCAEEHPTVESEHLAVLAFGKLGGAELNYSSDIDLAFLSRGDPPRFRSRRQLFRHRAGVRGGSF